jgi:peptide chain release factor subunit 1
MLTQREIRSLSAIRTESPCVSLYIDLSLRTVRAEQFRIEIKNKIAYYRDLLVQKAEVRQLDETLAQIESSLKGASFPTGVRGVAIFANAQEGIWVTATSHIPFLNQLYVEHSFFLHPLLAVIDNYEPFVGVIIDKRHAKLYTIAFGEVINRMEIIGNEHPGRPKSGGWSQNRYQRHNKQDALHHYREVAQHISKLQKRHKISRIILGGVNITLPHFAAAVPKQVANSIVASFRTELFEPESRHVEQLLEAEHAYELEEERSKIAGIRKNRSRMAAGIKQVLAAYAAGSIRELYVCAASKAQGTYDPKEKMLTTMSSSRRQSLSGDKQGHYVVPNVVPFLIHLVYEQGGSVEFIQENDILKDFEYIAALTA